MIASDSDHRQTILITGAGGAAVPGLITKLQGRGYRVLAADMNVNSLGFCSADQGFVIPKGNSPHFLPAIRKLCRAEQIKAVIPLVDEELEAACELEKDGVCVILPRLGFVNLCLDKLSLMRVLNETGINVPLTRLVDEDTPAIQFPLVVKPRRGRGSRGVGIVNTQKEMEDFLAKSSYGTNDLIIQEYIDGPEFTVSVVVWRDGRIQAVVPKEIIEKKGITRLAVTRRNEEIDRLCRDVQNELRADGPFNVQLRVDRTTKEPYIFEINPRFSTTVSLTIAAGVDELVLLIEQALLGLPAKSIENWSEGIVLIRKTIDHFVDESEYLGIQSRIKKVGE